MEAVIGQAKEMDIRSVDNRYKFSETPNRSGATEYNE